MRRSFRSPLLLASLLSVVAAIPALAQTAAPRSSYPACAAQPSPADVETAKKAFELGLKNFNEADYEHAVFYFKDAYRNDCTAHKILTSIGKAHEYKGDRAEAIVAYETYLERVPNAPDADVMRKRIANLKATLPPTPASTMPASTTPTTTATASETAPTASSAPPPSTSSASEGGHTIAPWIVTGVGAAALITGGALVIVGNGKVSDAEGKCPARQGCAQDVTDSGNSGRSLMSIGWIVGGVGVAAVAGGLIWHFVEPTGPETKKAVFTPLVLPGFAGASVGGRF